MHESLAKLVLDDNVDFVRFKDENTVVVYYKDESVCVARYYNDGWKFIEKIAS